MSQPPEPRQKTRPDGPRRVRNGLKLRRKEDETEWPWPATTWEQRLVTDVPSETMILALEYGRLGQTTQARVRPGSDHRQRPVRTGQGLPGANRVSGAQRGRLVDACCNAPRRKRSTRRSCLPVNSPRSSRSPSWRPGIRSSLRRRTLRVTCTCGAEGFNAGTRSWSACWSSSDSRNSPNLRWRSAAAASNASVRTCRKHACSRPVVSARHTPTRTSCGLAGPVRSIGSRLDEFWRPGPSLEAYRNEISQKHAHHALLRRLGSSPLEGRFPITGLLASIYDTVMDKAKEMRVAAESPPEPPDRRGRRSGARRAPERKNRTPRS